MSHSATAYTLVSALLAAGDKLGLREWSCVNQDQEHFLHKIFDIYKHEASRIPEIKSTASWNTADLNSFLSGRDFSIQLQELSQDEFGVAAVLDLLVKWLKKGDKTRIETEDKKIFPGVRIKKDNVQFFNSLGIASHPNPIAKLATKSEDEVYMTLMDNAPDSLDLILLAEKLLDQLDYNDNFSGLRFPMADFKHCPDLGWLLGMETERENSDPVVLSEAVQETKLRMNEEGARVKDAVAASFSITSATPPKPDYTINRPFLVIFKRPNLSLPLAVFYLEEDCWKEPAKL